MQPSKGTWNKSTRPETESRQPLNHLQETKKWTGNQKPSPSNDGTKSRRPGSESRQPETFTRQWWKQVQGMSNLNQATMEPSPGHPEGNSGNQKPSPFNHGTQSREPGTESRQQETFTRTGTKSSAPGSETRQPRTFTKQPWNQVQGIRDRIQATRKLRQAPLNQVQETKSGQPETFTKQLWKQVQEAMKWI